MNSKIHSFIRLQKLLNGEAELGSTRAEWWWRIEVGFFLIFIFCLIFREMDVLEIVRLRMKKCHVAGAEIGRVVTG